QRHGARAALSRGDYVQARAMLRSSLQTSDSPLSRALLWKLGRDRLLWRKPFSDLVYDVAFAPDGKTIAAGCQDGLVFLIDADTTATQVLRGRGWQIMSLAYSPAGRYLASGNGEGFVLLWDLEKGTAMQLGESGSGIPDVTFSHDGKLLATVRNGELVELWQVPSGTKAGTLASPTERLVAIAFSPDDSLLAAGGSAGSPMVFDLATRQARYSGLATDDLPATGKNERPASPIYAVAFSGDGSLIATGNGDGTVRLWEAASGTPRGELFSGHTDSVRGLAFDPSSQMLVSASLDRTVRLWDARTGQSTLTFRGHNSEVTSVAFSPDGRLVVSAGFDQTVSLWQASTRSELAAKEPAGHEAAAIGLDVNADGTLLASGGGDHTARLWDVASGRQLAVLSGHTGRLQGVALSPDGRLLATAGMDKTIRLWLISASTPENGSPATASARQHQVLSGHRGLVRVVAFSPDGSLLASGSDDRTVRIWDIANGTEQRTLAGFHTGMVYGVAFSPDGRWLASGDGSIALWEVANGKLVKRIEGSVPIAFSPDGRRLAMAESSGAIMVRDVVSGTSRALGNQPPPLGWPSFDPTGTKLGVPGSDGTSRIWNLDSGDSVTLRGHQGPVRTLRFAPDGAQAATTGQDGTLRLWDATTGRPVWRAPALLPTTPPRLFSHLGWSVLGQVRRTGTTLESSASPSWQQAIASRAHRASQTLDGSLGCLQTFDDEVEMWSMTSDHKLHSARLAGTESLEASLLGCLLLAERKAMLLLPSGLLRLLATEATACAWSGSDVLLAAERRIAVVDPTTGAIKSEYATEPGVSALTRASTSTGKWLLLGFRDGQIQLVSTTSITEKPSFGFEGVRSSRVVRVVEGPTGTIIAGYANGFLGVWSTANGVLLDSFKLHGPLTHILILDDTLHAATELGDSLVVDLGVFDHDYCTLLHRMWKTVPVLWEDGLPVLRPPPPGHECSQRV
ncbi:MAG: WD40 repeat domain-containing protein, partial [Pseudomonadota bacterium]